MTTRSVKPTINEESKKIAEEQITTSEMYRGYENYIKSINTTNENQKNSFKDELLDSGVELIEEMTENTKERNEIRINKIKYISKRTKKTFDDIDSHSDEDINQYYIELKDSHKGFFRKAFELLFNL